MVCCASLTRELEHAISVARFFVVSLRLLRGETTDLMRESGENPGLLRSGMGERKPQGERRFLRHCS